MALLSGELVEWLCREARAAAPREVCGVLAAGEAGEILHFQMPNLAAGGSSEYEMDPGALAKLLRQMERRGRRLVAFYHSHPGGSAQPSRRDREGLLSLDGTIAWPEVRQIIVAIGSDGACEVVLFSGEGDWRALERVCFPP